MLTTRAKAREVACPECHAPAGERCRLMKTRRDGRKDRSSCHIDRHAAATKTTDEDAPVVAREG